MECAEAELVSPQAMNGKYGSMVRKIFEDSQDFRGFARFSRIQKEQRLFEHQPFYVLWYSAYLGGEEGRDCKHNT
jgi:hypothetical protein